MPGGSGLSVIRREYWEDETFKYFGFSEDRMAAAARQQGNPDTCWAACLAVASSLVGATKWDNELKWYQLAQKNGVLSKPPRILENEFITLANNVSALRMKVYAKNDIAPHISRLLAENHVLLLWSEQHSVVLGRSWATRINPTSAMFSVIDPAVGAPRTWTLADVVAFTDSFVVDIAKGSG